MSAFGEYYALAAAEAVALCLWGDGEDGALGHHNSNNGLILTRRVDTQHFDDAQIVFAAAVLVQCLGTPWLVL